MTQNEMIRKYLEDGHSITPLDALNLFGCFRLSGRIFDLKKQGLDIVMENVEDKATGKHYAKYYLRRECRRPVKPVTVVTSRAGFVPIDDELF